MFPEGATCAIHTLERANRTCTRCGAFACSRCEENPFYPGLCPTCLNRIAGTASTRSIVAVALAGGSIACYCLPLGIPAAIVAINELAAIDRGESPEAGRSYAVAAKWIGIVTGALSILIGAGLGIAALVGAMNR